LKPSRVLISQQIFLVMSFQRSFPFNLSQSTIYNSQFTMTTASQEPFLVIQSPNRTPGSDIPIYFKDDWDTGIGGGLWSTGLAFAKYLTTHHAAQNLQQLAAGKEDQEGLSVLELGSGNSFLSVVFLGLTHQLEQLRATNDPGPTILKDLVITDLEDHLPLMKKILDANAHITISEKARVRILEHKWGEFLPPSGNQQELSLEAQVQQGSYKFDLIMGSDVAYHNDLHDILIASLLQYSHAKTQILIGVTMLDTKARFFDKLHDAGFTYSKLADHLLEPNFWGRTFGIFISSAFRDGNSINRYSYCVM